MAKPVVFSGENKEEGVFEDVSVSSVKNSITKNILVFLLGVFLIPFFVYLFSIFILPLLRGPAFSGVTLTYWGVWEDKKVLEKVIFDFERLHPNIRIDYQKQDIKAQGNYMNRLVMRMNSNTGPDILRFHNSWTSQMKDLLLPLPSDVVSDSQLETQYYNVVKKDVGIYGAYYGIPLGIDTLALFVNTEILESSGVNAPRDWNDLIDAAKKLTILDPVNNKKIIRAGIAMGTYENVDHASDIVSLLMLQNGVSFDNMSASLPSVVNAITYYTSFGIGNSRVWDTTFENSKLAFAKGKVAMMFGYSWDIFEITKINPGLKFAVHPVPYIPHLPESSAGKSSTIASYWVDGVSSRTKHPRESFEFLKFLAKRENLEKMYTEQSKLSQERIFGEPYPRRDMANLLSGNKTIYVFVQQANDASSTPFSSDTFDQSLNSSLNQYMANAVNGALSRSMSVETAVETMIKGTDQILKKYAK